MRCTINSEPQAILAVALFLSLYLSPSTVLYAKDVKELHNQFKAPSSSGNNIVSCISLHLLYYIKT